MINKQIFTLVIFYSLYIVSYGNDDNINIEQNFNNTTYTKDIKNLNITIQHLLSKEQPLTISLNITNNTNHDILLPHGYKALLESFSLLEDNKQVPYIGSFNLKNKNKLIIKSGTSYHNNNINLSKLYVVNKGTHSYEITLFPSVEWKSNTLEFDATLLKDGAPLQ